MLCRPHLVGLGQEEEEDFLHSQVQGESLGRESVKKSCCRNNDDAVKQLQPSKLIQPLAFCIKFVLML